jgi:hypothetical protein
LGKAQSSAMKWSVDHEYVWQSYSRRSTSSTITLSIRGRVMRGHA